MILDAFLQFTGKGSSAPSNGDGLNDTLTTATTVGSSGIIDLGIIQPALPPSQSSPYPYPFRDIGIGDDPAMKILIQIVGVATGGTSLAVGLQGAPDNGSGSFGSFTTMWAPPAAYTLAQLVQGARLMDMDMPRPPQGQGIPRFLTLTYTSVGTFANLLIRGNIVLDRHDQIYNVTNNAILGGYAPGVVIAN